MTHSRAAQANRAPRPIASGSSAATSMSQTTGERAAGPMANRMTSPQSGAVDDELGRPKMETHAFPASAVPITHGASRTSATPREAPAATSTLRPASRAPTSTAPSDHDNAATRTMGRMAGAKPVATAMIAPSTAICPRGCVRHAGPGGTSNGERAAARARRSAMNGKAA